MMSTDLEALVLAARAHSVENRLNEARDTYAAVIDAAHLPYTGIARRELSAICFIVSLQSEEALSLATFLARTGDYVTALVAANHAARDPGCEEAASLQEFCQRGYRAVLEGQCVPPPETLNFRHWKARAEYAVGRSAWGEAAALYRAALLERPHDGDLLLGLSRCETLLSASVSDLIFLARFELGVNRAWGIACMYYLKALQLEPANRDARQGYERVLREARELDA
jgi:hypothetical protein